MQDQIERLARRTLPVLFLLSLVGAGLLYFHITGPALQSYVVLYFIIAMPAILNALLGPFRLWKDGQGPPRDIPDEWR